MPQKRGVVSRNARDYHRPVDPCSCRTHHLNCIFQGRRHRFWPITTSACVQFRQMPLDHINVRSEIEPLGNVRVVLRWGISESDEADSKSTGCGELL